jgi:sugar transferase (PEP-CTERM/EpsH1 system associated)
MVRQPPANSRRISPIRVMHVVYALQPGGMELGVVKLVNGLDPLRVQSAICSTRQAGILKQQVSPRVPLFELHGRRGNDVRLVWRLYRLFRREHPDIVHTHGWGTVLEGLIAARLAGVAAVVHGEHGTLQVRAYQRLLQRVAWSAANRVLSVSSRLAERMTSEMRVDAGRITTIRNGVDLERFRPGNRADARASLALKDRSVIVGTVGRLVPVKDHATLLEAVALLRRRGIDAKFVLSGDGPLNASIRARASALGISDNVHLLGHREDVETVLAALDVFVLSSLSEGLSNTILEAMAMGLPVVATRVGGADELVRDGLTGVLVPPHAPREMADGLAQLLQDGQARQAMGAAGRARVEAEFALSVMVARYEALYMDLAALTSGGASSSRVGRACEMSTLARVSDAELRNASLLP